MSARSASRAASEAKRSGAAALRLRDFRPGRDDCGDAWPHLSFSFAPAPARWFRIRLWRQPYHRCRARPVLWFQAGQGDRTGKRLIMLGSVVLFWRPLREAGTCMQPRLRKAVVAQNHRTTELSLKKGRNQPIQPGRAVLSRFCGSGSNIIGRGYPAGAIVRGDRADQRLVRGAAPRKFRGWKSALGRDQAGRLIELGRASSAGRNGGFLPFSGAALGHVGMAMSERSAQSTAIAAFSRIGRKLLRLRASLALGAPGADREAPGRLGQAEGAGPPFAARQIRCMLAQPIFWISTDPHNRMTPDGAGSSSWIGQTGSGARHFSPSRRPGREKRPQSDREKRVGDGGGSGSSWWENGEQGKLWGGRDHVNA